MSKHGGESQTRNIEALYMIIHDLRPLLAQEGEWTLNDAADDANVELLTLRGPLQRCIRNGAVKQIEKERSGGKSHWRYRWCERPKERLQAYLDEMDTLPCGCRCHIPSGRAYPDEWVKCTHCNVAYKREWFMDFVEDKL